MDFSDTDTDVTVIGEVEWVSSVGAPPDEPFCWFDGNNPVCRYSYGGKKSSINYVIGMKMSVKVSVKISALRFCSFLVGMKVLYGTLAVIGATVLCVGLIVAGHNR